MNGFDPLDRDRIGIVTGGLLLSLALSRFLSLVGLPVSLPWLPPPLTVSWLLPWLEAALVIGLAAAGTLALIRNHPRVRRQPLDHIVMYCLTPMLLAGGFSVVLGDLVDWELWVITLIGAGGLFALTITVEYLAVSPRVRATPGWGWAMLLVNHLSALVLLAAVVGWQASAFWQSVMAFIAAAFLSARLLWGLGGQLEASFLYGLTCAVLMAQATWAISYWPLGRLRTSLLLLVLYYVIVGLLLQHRQGRLDGRVARDYGLVALGALLLVVLLPR